MAPPAETTRRLQVESRKQATKSRCRWLRTSPLKQRMVDSISSTNNLPSSSLGSKSTSERAHGQTTHDSVEKSHLLSKNQRLHASRSCKLTSACDESTEDSSTSSGNTSRPPEVAKVNARFTNSGQKQEATEYYPAVIEVARPVFFCRPSGRPRVAPCKPTQHIVHEGHFASMILTGANGTRAIASHTRVRGARNSAERVIQRPAKVSCISTGGDIALPRHYHDNRKLSDTNQTGQGGDVMTLLLRFNFPLCTMDSQAEKKDLQELRAPRILSSQENSNTRGEDESQVNSKPRRYGMLIEIKPCDGSGIMRYHRQMETDAINVGGLASSKADLLDGRCVPDLTSCSWLDTCDYDCVTRASMVLEDKYTTSFGQSRGLKSYEPPAGGVDDYARYLRTDLGPHSTKPNPIE